MRKDEVGETRKKGGEIGKRKWEEEEYQWEMNDRKGGGKEGRVICVRNTTMRKKGG